MSYSPKTRIILALANFLFDPTGIQFERCIWGEESGEIGFRTTGLTPEQRNTKLTPLVRSVILFLYQFYESALEASEGSSKTKAD